MMGPIELEREIERRGMSRAEFARALGVSRGIVTRWLSLDPDQNSPVPPWMPLVLKGLDATRENA